MLRTVTKDFPKYAHGASWGGCIPRMFRGKTEWAGWLPAWTSVAGLFKLPLVCRIFLFSSILTRLSFASGPLHKLLLFPGIVLLLSPHLRNHFL